MPSGTMILSSMLMLVLAAAITTEETTGLVARSDCPSLLSTAGKFVGDIGSIAEAAIKVAMSIASTVSDGIETVFGGTIFTLGPLGVSIYDIVKSAIHLASTIGHTASVVPWSCLGSLFRRDEDYVRVSQLQIGNSTGSALEAAHQLGNTLLSLEHIIGGNKTDETLSQILSEGKVLIGGLLNATSIALNNFTALAGVYGGELSEVKDIYTKLW